MTIPSYPEFRPLELSDLDDFSRASREDPLGTSELVFSNLYAWRDSYKMKVARLNDFLLLRSDAAKQPEFLPPLGRGDKKALVEKVLCGSGGIFIRAPEKVVALFENDARFKLDLHRDDADYLYRVKDLVALTGSKYDGKRNLIKKFKATQRYEYFSLLPANIPECLEFEEEWCRLKNCEKTQGLSDERRAIRDLFAHFALFQLVGGAIRVQGKICAVAFGQRLNADTLVLHVLKANPNLKGLYQVMNQEFLAHEGNSFEYVNMEQDLGLPGLRKAKLSYHPLRLINKYTIGLAL